MALIDRLDPPEGVSKISAHRFAAVMYLYCLGKVSRAVAISRLGLTAADEAQFDQVKAKHDGLLQIAEKFGFHGQLEACLVLLETKDMSRAEVSAVLGIT